MATSASTRVFTSGDGQAVRIPKEFRISTDRVTIRRVGNELRITPEPLTGADVLELISEDTPGFWDGLYEPDDPPEEDLHPWED